MHPIVNVVDDSKSRIRTLEEQVNRLRNELALKERTKQSEMPKAEELERSGSMQERLHAQMLENRTLIQDRETLARCALLPAPLSSLSRSQLTW
jgi:hypothetical protein